MVDLFAELDSRDQRVQKESATVLKDMYRSAQEETGRGTKKLDSKARHFARQARKAVALTQNFPPSNPEVDAQVERETRQEAASIKQTCDELGVQIHEINPDGHCLFSAIADQLALLNILPPNQANYAVVRAAASDYIYGHPDDFLPFLPSISGEDGVGATENTGLMNARQFEQYCLTIRDTAAWGGEPEVLALSRSYNIPIQVVQGGTPSVVVHAPDGNLPSNLGRGAKVVRISFHRRMYGLGEHYNSLRPKNALTTVADKIQSILS
ncbi:hypothetical protein PAXRUDRAFT_139716 [Paxillus rubicundulus Ve08.2h10]|uniref:Unplaced genomic scaffold scaffold_193, whole genome shotgun sequence n=1 Tax=Paxillus rubicundulus Ve08.2h10 TaxID=930991 RepID=A0A0D0E455_9AGAM|nr:hypothetical protein PAXRUDRAFT_139716 [Paxillus rubicundulus Ve08.2h10]